MPVWWLYLVVPHGGRGCYDFCITKARGQISWTLRIEVVSLPGVLAYGSTQDDAIGKTEALVLRVLAERIEAGESRPIPILHWICRCSMNRWSATKANLLLAALIRLGWSTKRQSGSHRTLFRDGWPDFVFAFHPGDEIGLYMLARIAKHIWIKT